MRLIALVFTVFALAAVPAAFADDGSTAPTPAGQQQAGRAGNPGLEILRLRLQLVELRFAKHCGSSSSGAPQRCIDFATKVVERLTKLDGNIQDRIAKIQSTCSSTSTDAKCKHASDRVALLQKLDTRIQAIEQKAKDWLAGKAVTTDPNADSSLDQAAAGLVQVVQQAGANG